MNKFSNLTVARRGELVTEGWCFADGCPAKGGYYAARESGGYRRQITSTPTPVILVTEGTPSYHAEVAWKAR
jgi:hypothetical protein